MKLFSLLKIINNIWALLLFIFKIIFLHHLFVAPSVQNQGVGSTLLASAEKLFNDTGYLKCLSENKTALAFYKHHAWKAVSTGESDDGAYVLMSKEKIIK
ncbi:GNAT family N-acetyltransferase [Acinetobacter bereziniae]|uniref:GNAT family N-acetyltransferase n=1 Tax=Acinetobacter bereziniae TaxID=106648 RepID=UPI002955E001|nr:GNAT family N-acetyltransferase [Acinetobacter bereziniae]MDV8154647.1 GNAT family N-acetyltransferase [Acinetobacter bereziniae]